MEKVLIIIPAFNEEKNLEELLIKINNICPQFDVLVINDCSRDNTSAICKKCNVKVVDLPVNLGIGGAVQTGYKYALIKDYDIAVQVDGDGQHNPSFIQPLVNEVLKGSNLCIGSRFIDKQGFQSSRVRRFGIKYFSALIKLLTKQEVTDPTSGARACDKKVIRYFADNYPKDYPEPETIVKLKKKNLKISEIPVVMNERKEGTSSITIIKSVYYMIKVSLAIVIDAFSTASK